jgi:hypothetical protein
MENNIEIDPIMLYRAINNMNNPSPELQAGCLYIMRRDLPSPEGYFNKLGRFYPTGRDAEVMPSCPASSIGWPYPETVSYCTLEHCARYHEADPKLARRVASAIDHLTKGIDLPKPAQKYVPLLKASYITGLL